MKLNCAPMLTHNPTFSSPVITPYEYLGAGIFVTKDNILINNPITNCNILSWSFGDTCGGTLTGVEAIE